MEGFKCEECGFELWLPIIDLEVSQLSLYDDNRYPGRCLLAYKPHRTNFEGLWDEEMIAFMRDVKVAGQAIHAATGADRMNYAILGNAVPHVHAHLIPRIFEGDPVPNNSPWNHPDKARPLPEDQKDRLIAELRSMLHKN